MGFTAKAILFDMDGVLIDSAHVVERVWRKWALAHHLDPEIVVEQAHGRRSIETLRAVAPAMDAERENLKVEQLEIDDRQGVSALAGAAQMLRSLPPERFAIVTSATRPLAVARLGYAGIPVPRHMVAAEDVAHGKPSPEPYLKGATLLDVAPADCLVFEDTPAGVAAARAAGMRVIGVGNTYPEQALYAAHADAVVNSLAEIKAEIREDAIQMELTATHQRR
jgi:mannitol-1-/sugar-/sorbitol-6-phosphatase